MQEFLRHEIVENRNALVHRILFFPRTRFHFLESASDNHLDVSPAQAPRGTAAVHGCIAATQDDDALANLVDMTERDGRKPIDPDVDILCRLLASGHIEVAPARRTGAYKNRIKVLIQQFLHAVDSHAAAKGDPGIHDIADFLINDFLG